MTHEADETRSSPKAESPLKILFLPTWYPDSEDPVPGVFTREHARAAARSGEVRVVHVAANRAGDCRGSICDVVETGIPVRRVRYATWPLANALQSWASGLAGTLSKSPDSADRALAKLFAAMDAAIRGARFLVYCLRAVLASNEVIREGWRPDVIHAHVYGAGFPALLLGRARSIPVVVSEHSSGLTGGGLNRFELLKAKAVARGVDMMLPVSEPVAAQLRALGAARVTVVPNVIDPVSAPPSTATPGSRKELIAMTSHGPSKGLDVLMEATAIVALRRDDFRLTVVGIRRKDLVRLAPDSVRLEREGVVRMLGKLEKKDAFELLSKSDFLVHPTLFESFRLVAFEAVMHGKPVVATDIEAFREVGDTGAGILVAPGDASAFADGMMRMLDGYRCYDVSELAERIAGRCRCEEVGRSLDSIYREVVGGQRAASTGILEASRVPTER